MLGTVWGPAFILTILENLDSPVRGAFLVSSFLGLLGNEEFDSLNETFTVKEFNWEKIKQNCNHFTLINSLDDPYVPIEKGRELADHLDVRLIEIENAGHINLDAGYKEFPLLLEKIKEIM